jgi:hypothetical protein
VEHERDDSVNDMVTPWQILQSARKHGIPDADIICALGNIHRYLEQEYDDEVRVLVIGTDRDGRFLEIVAVPADTPRRVIHADLLRPKFYSYL